MSYLFIDSTYDLSLGVLSEELRWLAFERKTGQKASAVIQTASYELLSKNNLKPEQLSGIITVNGPGFYTGLRLAEGFSNVFKFFGVKEYSFYSYEIPYWCGFEEGNWFTKAYKGEYFFHRWVKDQGHHQLVSAKELDKAFDGKKLFIHSDIALDANSSSYLTGAEKTFDLLQNYPEKIFPHVLKGLNREPFYFRAPEDEFKANP